MYAWICFTSKSHHCTELI
jgi:hypothetical protein